MHRISCIENNIYYYKTAKFAATHNFFDTACVFPELTRASVLEFLFALFSPIENLCYRLIFDLGKSRQKTNIPGKNLSKVVKLQNLAAKC